MTIEADQAIYDMKCEATAIGILDLLNDGPGTITLSECQEEIFSRLRALGDETGINTADVMEHTMYYFDRIPGNPYAGAGMKEDARADLEAALLEETSPTIS